jgi:hypothetical protein
VILKIYNSQEADRREAKKITCRLDYCPQIISGIYEKLKIVQNQNLYFEKLIRIIKMIAGISHKNF